VASLINQENQQNEQNDSKKKRYSIIFHRHSVNAKIKRWLIKNRKTKTEQT